MRGCAGVRVRDVAGMACVAGVVCIAGVSVVMVLVVHAG
jgi:hypothetical protein